jgi:hypothetical protein
MLANANIIDPWVQTIGLLSALSGATNAASRLTDRSVTRHACGPEYFGVKVCLIDRPTTSTATIAWSDSTRCCYGDQVWRSSRARAPGVCAMSGRPIHPGDAVYRPRPCRPMPLNASAMILTSALNDAAAT